MRHKLKKYYDERLRFTATVERFGKKNAYRGLPLTTLLLSNVCLGDTEVAGHLWMTAGKWSEHLAEGDRFSFNARCDKYIKGYRGYREDVYDAPIETDFRLVRPTNIEILNPRQLTITNTPKGSLKCPE